MWSPSPEGITGIDHRRASGHIGIKTPAKPIAPLNRVHRITKNAGLNVGAERGAALTSSTIITPNRKGILH
jgi:hypothetical protein